MIKNLLPGSFVRLDVNRRTRKSKFFYQIDALIDWAIFEKALHKVCKRSIKDAAGRSAYTPLVLFKRTLLQTRYNLPDRGVEDMVSANLAANTFCGIRIEDTVPAHSTRVRFRSVRTEKYVMNRLLARRNSQLEGHGIEVWQEWAV